MGGLWYKSAVVVFWLVSMSWLLGTKVLPPLMLGTPPTYSAILKDQPERRVGWDLFWNDRPAGTALSETKHTDDGITEVHSRVRIDGLTLADLSPLRINLLGGAFDPEKQKVSMHADSEFDIDPLGRLLSFEATLRMSPLPEPIRVLGNVEGNQMVVTVRSDDFSYRTTMYMPPDRPVGDTLAPQLRLPRLRLGQTWTEPVYNPFMPATQPMELVQAAVEREDYLNWNGTLQPVLLVTYRPERGLRSDGTPLAEPRGRAWVRPRDGEVLQQEARVGSAVLRFVRQTGPVAGAAMPENSGAAP